MESSFSQVWDPRTENTQLSHHPIKSSQEAHTYHAMLQLHSTRTHILSFLSGKVEVKEMYAMVVYYFIGNADSQIYYRKLVVQEGCTPLEEKGRRHSDGSVFA